MYIDGKDPRNATALIALDGVVVGAVLEADTAAGWVVRFDLGPEGFCKESELSSRPIVRQEGRVDYVGESTWSAARNRARLEAIRREIGLPPIDGVPATLKEAIPWVLGNIMDRLVIGDVDLISVKHDKEHDVLPLADGAALQLPTGKLTLTLEYVVKELAEQHAHTVRAWSEKNPDLVPAYVNAREDRRLSGNEGK